MRKLILMISVMALPLAACGKEEPMPAEPEEAQEVQEVIEEPASPAEGDAPATEPDADPAPEVEEGATAE